jgi:transposase
MEKETFSMSLKENSRLIVLASVDRGELSVEKAAELLKRSVRQTKRLLRAWREAGATALVHGNRGRVPVNVLSAEARRQVIALLTGLYTDFNNQHVASLLQRDHNLTISRMTVSRIRQSLGLATPKRRRSPRPHQRRERMPQLGLLVQIDGSKHRWFEQRGPECCLIAAVDDATGMLLGAIFRNEEDVFGYMLMLRQVLDLWGVPVAVYSDRHTIHLSPGSAQHELAALGNPTQFGRCLSALGISQIFALSPEAKGRIERLFLSSPVIGLDNTPQGW